MAKIRIEINGEEHEMAAGNTLASYAEAKGIAEQSGVAVAINGRVIRRCDWATTTLSDGDKIMVLTAAQGG